MNWTVYQRSTLAVLCILFAGCTVCENARRTVCTEPSVFNWKKDKRRSLALYSRWADEAWQDELQSCPELFERPDYNMGFRDGFVDFVYAGGSGEPPPIPPRKLWNVAFRSDDGHRRTEDWFAGYRHGARIARDGGYRSMATLRSSLFGLPEDEQPYSSPTMLPHAAIDSDGQWPYSESLPTPAEQPLPAPSAPAADEEDPKSTDGAPQVAAPRAAAPEDKPKLPPVPRNLPPTVPRNPERSEFDEPPAERETRTSDPKSTPAKAQTSSESVEPAPLTIPPAAPDSVRLNVDPANTMPVSRPAITSVRFMDVPTVIETPPRAKPLIPPTVSPVRQALGDFNTSALSPSANSSTGIRLTVATSPIQPARPMEAPSSTLTIRQGWNALRSPASSERKRAASVER